MIIMYKIIIVDDEPTVREGLKTLIEWEKYGFEIVGLAKDGKSALEQYYQYRPEVIISDIKMTGMNGLELIKHVRKIDSEIQCLILSGYADFEYAKTAIQNNVAGYLLKPIYEEELIDYLEKVKNELDLQQEMKQLTIQEQERQREQVILSLLSGETINDLSKELVVLNINWQKYQIMVLKLSPRSSHECNIMTAKEELKKLFQHGIKSIVFLHESYIGVLLNRTCFQYKDLHFLYQEMVNRLNWNRLDYTVALGSCVDHITNLSSSLKLASNLIENRFFFPEDTLLVEEMLFHNETTNELDTSELIDTLSLALDIGAFEQVESSLSEYNYRSSSEQELKKKYVYILTTVLTKLQKSNPDKEQFMINIIERSFNIYQTRSIEELLNFVTALLKEVFDELDYVDTDHQLKKLISLMEKRYDENLKLERLAELFNYNSAYLGKLFKSYTGEYFNTYLDKIRIENAKKLLVEGLKVYRVAEVVGYNNVDYFHSKFKKYEGVSPSTYRRKQLQE